MKKSTPYETRSASVAGDPGARCMSAARSTGALQDRSTETAEEKARRREFVFALMEGRNRRRGS